MHLNKRIDSLFSTAMGPRNACVYTNVVMDPVHRPLLWARFRDEIYVPWTYGIELLEDFHE